MADVNITIGAKDKASGVLSKVSQNLNKFGLSASRIKVGITGAVSSVTALGAAAVKMTNDFARAGDNLHKMSLRTKLSVESLSQLKFAAEQSGTSIEQVSSAIFRAFRRIGNAQTETGPAARAVKELGLDVKELAQIKPEQLFFRLTDALNSVQDPLRRSQLGFEIFGNNWRQLVPLIEQGSTEIQRLMRQMDELGGTMTTEQAEAAAAYTDAMNELKTALIGVRNALGAEMAPTLTRLSEQMTRLTVDTQRWGIALKGLQVSVIDFVDPLQRMGMLQERRAELVQGMAQGLFNETFSRIIDSATTPSAGDASTGTDGRGEAGSFFSATKDFLTRNIKDLMRQVTIAQPIIQRGLGNIVADLVRGGASAFNLPEERRPFGPAPTLQAVESRLLTRGPTDRLAEVRAEESRKREQEAKRREHQLDQLHLDTTRMIGILNQQLTDAVRMLVVE